MALVLYLATASGLFIADPVDGGWSVRRRYLSEQALNTVVVIGETVLAGGERGIWRSTDGGNRWRPVFDGTTAPHVRWMVWVDGSGDTVLAGAEPAGIYVSTTRGATWREASGVSQLRDTHRWRLPYSPAAGCVRDFGASSHGGINRLYAAVEVGGVLTSTDGGGSWVLVPGSDGSPELNRGFGSGIHPDVHSLHAHPANGAITAATGGGLYRSNDVGASWVRLHDGYVRAVWVDSADPDHIIAGPADGVSRGGRIERTVDGGAHWRPFSDGMNAPWPRHMVDRFFFSERRLFAVLSGGDLWERSLNGGLWKQVLSKVEAIRGAALGRVPETARTRQ
jgi:hypothetical protein